MKPRVYYDKETDSMYILAKKGVEEGFVEIADGINIELDKNKKIIGIEILNASSVLMPVAEKIHARGMPIGA